MVHLCSGCQGNGETWRHEASDLLPRTYSGFGEQAARRRLWEAVINSSDQQEDDTRVCYSQQSQLIRAQYGETERGQRSVGVLAAEKLE